VTGQVLYVCGAPASGRDLLNAAARDGGATQA
jgi:hypothetical protein